MSLITGYYGFQIILVDNSFSLHIFNDNSSEFINFNLRHLRITIQDINESLYGFSYKDDKIKYTIYKDLYERRKHNYCIYCINNIIKEYNEDNNISLIKYRYSTVEYNYYKNLYLESINNSANNTVVYYSPIKRNKKLFKLSSDIDDEFRIIEIYDYDLEYYRSRVDDYNDFDDYDKMISYTIEGQEYYVQ